MNTKRAKHILKLFVGLLMVLAYTPTLAGSGTVTWSEPDVALDVQQGERLIQPLEFSVTRRIRSIRIEAVPSISDVVSIVPQQFEALQPGVIYTIQLVVAPSTETQIGVHAGTIHVRDGTATIPEPLKVKISIKEGDSDDDYASPGRL